MLEIITLWDVFDLFILSFSSILLFITISNLSENKFCKTKIYLIISILILFFFIMRVYDVDNNLRVIITIIIFTIFYKHNYYVNISKSILVPLIYYMIVVVADAIAVGIIGTLYNISIQIIAQDNIFRFQAAILSSLFLLICFLIFKWIKPSAVIDRKDFIYIGIPICVNILCLMFIYSYNFQAVDSKYAILISLLMLLSSISLIAIVSKIIKNNILQIENNLIKEKVNMEYKYYNDIKNNYDKTRLLHHDMKNHMTCISNLDDIEKIKSYVENINLELNTIDTTFNTGNTIIDIIMSEKKSICVEKGILFESSIDFSRVEFIDMMDICIIFSNILDNAIQACDKVEKNLKYINIKVTYVNNFCLIKVENSKSNEIKKINGKIVTDKKDKYIHGLGINNIKNTVKKYNGELAISYKANLFKVVVMIPINKNSPVMYN